MTEHDTLATETLRRLTWQVRLARAGLVSERIVRGFWPVWTIAFLVIAALGFGLQDVLPLEALWFGGLAALAGFLFFLGRGIRRFRWPGRDEALARLDAALPGRPIGALTDSQAVGAGDPGSAAVWQAHRERMAARAAQARAGAPDLRVAARDPFALRYAALAAVLMALMFGSLWRVADVAAIAAGGAPADVAGGPAWEAWIEPPSYTGKPSLYLNEIAAAELTVPEGSRLTVRTYAGPGVLSVAQTLGDEAPLPEGVTRPANVTEVEIARSGRLAIEGPGGREWTVTVTPDAPPGVAFSGEMGRDGDGAMKQVFTATDDHGVTGGKATIRLDLAAVERRFGLATEPEPREDFVVDLPMPISGSRTEFTETLAEDASEHPWANLPVTITLTVEDGRGQTGATAPKNVILPGRRFFDPLGAAIIEMRRDLLWSRANAPRVLQVLKAFTHRPEGFIPNGRAYLMLRVATRRLGEGVAAGPISAELRDEIAAAFWEIAVLLEDGGLSDALARMQQAQERLSEAMRNGASPEEIQRLMDELRDATNDYIRQLAENAERQEDGLDEPGQQAQNEGQRITGDQLQQMMDEIQRLMEEGRFAEAQELLDQLQRMMENMRVVQGEGGEGQEGQGNQTMRGLQETLRGQQELSDDTFRDLQNQFGQGEPGEGQGDMPGRQPGERGQGEMEGQGDGGSGAEGQGSLADRQRALRDQLGRLGGSFPGLDSPEGEASRDALNDAGRAMSEAEEALREGDNAGALDRQAEAIESLREGLRELGEALAQEQGQQVPGGQGEQVAQGERVVPRDPLGRELGSNGRIGTDEELLQGEDVYRRARDLLEEIRRRSGERNRPEAELDYLRRLLDQF